MKDDDDSLELLKLLNNEASTNEAQVNLDSNVADPSQSQKVKEDDQPTKGPGPYNYSSQEETHPPSTNNDSKDEEELIDQPQPPGYRL